MCQAREKQRSGWEQWSSRTSGGGRANRPGRVPSGRAMVLEPHIQGACAAAAAAVVSALDSRLSALPPAADGPTGAAVVEQALLLGARAHECSIPASYRQYCILQHGRFLSPRH